MQSLQFCVYACVCVSTWADINKVRGLGVRLTTGNTEAIQPRSGWNGGGGQEKTGAADREEHGGKSSWGGKQCTSVISLGRALGSHSRPRSKARAACEAQEVTLPAGWRVACGTCKGGVCCCGRSLHLCRRALVLAQVCHIMWTPLWDSWEKLGTHMPWPGTLCGS